MRRNGTRKPDILSGGDGKDRLKGKGGDDALFGYDDDDRLWGGGGNDGLFGFEGDDFLFGGGGIDALYGGEGRDVLRGGGGHDVLLGGEGGDRLWGGKGLDNFMIGHSDAADRIMDWRARDDQITILAYEEYPDFTGVRRKDVKIVDKGRWDHVRVEGETVAKVKGEVTQRDIDIAISETNVDFGDPLLN
ncbi:MAG: calcium-binding protein [Pseudomonadota bacterium]